MEYKEDIISQLNYLNETKNLIKLAIISKGPEILDTTPFREYVEKIKSIQVGIEGGIDTSDATATASDLAEGKTAYVNGEKILGKVTVPTNGSGSRALGFGWAPSVSNYRQLRFDYTFSESRLYRKDVTFSLFAGENDIAKFLEITPDQIVKGNTILSVEGTGELLDTSDADATELDIVYPKTAYVNGEKIEGALSEILSDEEYAIGSISIDGIAEQGELLLTFSKQLPNTEVVIRDGAIGKMTMLKSTLRNYLGITADIIKAGESILDVEGTLEGGIDTSDATATANDIAIGKTAYINGEKIEGALPEFSSSVSLVGSNNISIQNTQKIIFFKANAGQTSYIARNGFAPMIWETFDTLATAIGLTADKIKKGETILGIEGTYEGGTLSEADYTEAIYLADDILGYSADNTTPDPGDGNAPDNADSDIRDLPDEIEDL